MNIIAEPLTFDFEPSEIWAHKPPKRGDHIRVKRMNGLYYHHGIFVSGGEVIHFTGDDDDSVLDWSRAHVIKTDLQQFLRGGDVEVKEYSDAELADLYPVEGIVSYARTCLGDDGYNLIFNNCEHFANACTLGKYRSRQVENFFGGKTMGLWGSIKSFFGFGSSSSRSSSSYNYNYEPDKVKIAEIERDTKLKLADKEAERIELMRDAQLEFIKAQTMSQMAIDKARVEGMTDMANQLVVLQEKMLDVAKKRIAIIEEGSLPIIREIESFYDEVGDKISADNDEYNTKKLPQLLGILRQYEKGSPEHEIFSAQIREDMARQGKFIEQQMARVSERQNLVLQSFLSTKEKIIEQTGQITQSIAEGYLKRQVENLLPQGSASLKALPNAEPKQLPPAD
ncbi:MAG: lecithin retinol acyltransferase family protein [Selenomonadaceae bacterium]|nr:lecithin retinol acyltransferase family protein [Selenomonadaceae bacterium]MBR6886903.1 lecithin retinol acyltransferase family protein [Selenomonadaceae bacterium]